MKFSLVFLLFVVAVLAFHEARFPRAVKFFFDILSTFCSNMRHGAMKWWAATYPNRICCIALWSASVARWEWKGKCPNCVANRKMPKFCIFAEWQMLRKLREGIIFSCNWILNCLKMKKKSKLVCLLRMWTVRARRRIVPAFVIARTRRISYNYEWGRIDVLQQECIKIFSTYYILIIFWKISINNAQLWKIMELTNKNMNN